MSREFKSSSRHQSNCRGTRDADARPSFMRRFLSGYTISYNRRHKRHGHLFHSEAKKSYRKFVKNGIEQEKRPDLTGGGLIRSIGGCEYGVSLAETAR